MIALKNAKISKSTTNMKPLKGSKLTHFVALSKRPLCTFLLENFPHQPIVFVVLINDFGLKSFTIIQGGIDRGLSWKKIYLGPKIVIIQKGAILNNGFCFGNEQPFGNEHPC